MKIPFFNREVLSLHAAALILGGAAFLSRILGLFRDRLLAARFGAGDVLDAYYAAFQIPDILFTVFLVGAAAAAVLPLFMEYEHRGRKEAEKFVANLLTVFAVFSVIISAVAAILAPWLVSIVVPGFAAGKLALTVSLTRLMLFSAAFLGIAGIVSAVLQARHRFFVFALPPILYNVCIIFGVVFLVPLFGPKGLAFGVLAGGLAQVLVQIPALKEMGFKFRFGFDLQDSGLRRVIKTSLPRVAALAMSQLTISALAAAASFFVAGSVSVFKLASNLMYVPVGLFGASYALAIFPKLSGASLDKRGEKFKEHVAIGIRNIFFWVMPFATLIIVLRAHIVRVVLGSGVFDWEDTRLVAAVLAVLAVAIVSESILPLVIRAFYALGKTREPLIWDIVGSLATIMFAVGFAILFSARPGFLFFIARALRIGDLAAPKIISIALGFSIGSLVNVVLLALSLYRTVRENLGVSLAFEWNSLATMLGASVLSGVAAYAALLPFPSIVATNTFWGIFFQGAAAGAVGLGVYWAILAWQKNPEILGLFESFKKRLVNIRRVPQVYETEKFDSYR